MPLGTIFTLNDVVNEIENAYDTEPSTIQKLSLCANATVPHDTIDGVKPTKLSDWEGFPKVDTFSHFYDMVGGFASTNTRSGIKTNTQISYNCSYDHAGSLDTWEPDFIYEFPDDANFGKYSLGIDKSKTSISETSLIDYSVIDTKAMPRYVSNGKGTIVRYDYDDGVWLIETPYMPSINQAILDDALYIWSSTKLSGVDPVRYFNGNNMHTTLVARRRFYPLIGGAKGTGYITTSSSFTASFVIEAGAAFGRGGYIHKVIRNGPTKSYAQLGSYVEGKFGSCIRSFATVNGIKFALLGA